MSTRRVVVTTAAAALVSQLPASLGMAAPTPVLAVSPARALLDEPVNVRLSGLRPREKVALVATTRDAVGIGWRSRLVFETDRSGLVDTRSNMKLFRSMRPTRDSSTATFLKVSPGEMTVLVRALVGGRALLHPAFSFAA